MTSPIVLALDPSFRNTGWVVVSVSSPEVVIDAGVICTKKADKRAKAYAGDDNHRCSTQIARGLNDLVETFRPVLVVAEAQAGSKNSRAAQLMGMAWGVLSSVMAVRDIPVLQARPTDVKLGATGSRAASKEEVEAAMRALWPTLGDICKRIRPPSLHEHVYDAVAAYVACRDSTEVHTLRRIG
jgi:Holliday junction resolvasome RuvABC endonuclease subunit